MTAKSNKLRHQHAALTSPARFDTAEVYPSSEVQTFSLNPPTAGHGGASSDAVHTPVHSNDYMYVLLVVQQTITTIEKEITTHANN